MKRHVGAATLARYREGDLSDRRAARIRAHLAGCRRCTALDEDLAGVSAMLASAPVPAMPEQVTARISAALTAEAARPARLGAGHEAGQPGHSRHASGPGPGRRWRLPELLSPLAVRAGAVAAAAAVLAGGVYGAVQLAGGPPASTASSASGISGPARTGLHAAAGTGPPLTYTRAGHPAQFIPVSTGRDFQPGLLRSQVRSLLTREAGPSQPVSGRRPARRTRVRSGALDRAAPRPSRRSAASRSRPCRAASRGLRRAARYCSWTWTATRASRPRSSSSGAARAARGRGWSGLAARARTVT